MTANIRIITPNDADAATLTVSPAAVTTLPVTNLQDPARARLWRSTSAADQTIYGAWANSYSVSGFALVRHNLSPSATLRLLIYEGPAQTGTVLYDSGSVSVGTMIGWGEFVYGVDPWGGSNIFFNWDEGFSILWMTAVVAARSFELRLVDAVNASGYIQASRLTIGRYFEPLVNMQYGLSMSWEENSKQFRTDGGTLRTDAIDPFRRWEFKLGVISEAQRAQLVEIVRRAGMRNDLFLDCFPEVGGSTERDYSGQAKLVQVPKFGYDQFTNFETSLVFEES